MADYPGTTKESPPSYNEVVGFICKTLGLQVNQVSPVLRLLAHQKLRDPVTYAQFEAHLLYLADRELAATMPKHVDVHQIHWVAADGTGRELVGQCAQGYGSDPAKLIAWVQDTEAIANNLAIDNEWGEGAIALVQFGDPEFILAAADGAGVSLKNDTLADADGAAE